MEVWMESARESRAEALSSGGVTAGVAAMVGGGLTACSPQQKNAADNPVAGEETKSTLGPNQHQAKTIGIDEMTVTMEIVDGKIKSVDIDANESPECGQGFIPMLAQQIKDKQSGDIDVISGALICLD